MRLPTDEEKRRVDAWYATGGADVDKWRRARDGTSAENDGGSTGAAASAAASAAAGAQGDDKIISQKLFKVIRTLSHTRFSKEQLIELHGACDHLYKDGDKTTIDDEKDKREDIYDAVVSDLTKHIQ